MRNTFTEYPQAAGFDRSFADLAFWKITQNLQKTSILVAFFPKKLQGACNFIEIDLPQDFFSWEFFWIAFKIVIFLNKLGG